MGWKYVICGAVVLVLVVAGPFITHGNALASSLYSLITAAVATGIGIWASWKYSKNSDNERLTRYGLQAWRNVDALSVKVSQQIQAGSAGAEILQSWLLDIDQAKWSWRDLLRDLFELQERLKLEQEEVAQKYKFKIESAKDPIEKQRLEDESRIEIAKISAQAPLPISGLQNAECPSCLKNVSFPIGPEIGASAWPLCDSCGATFPVHRKGESHIHVNADAVKIPVARECPYCKHSNILKVPKNKSVKFNSRCVNCSRLFQCEGDAFALVVFAAASEATI
ncbi:hypothetical protein VB738_06480 [Cyanobium gracile UHCC 0139]|uniref:C2H2-type domain-containing protein n=1 Tax=Cyanobium gracile UHCC 0139 TaxID=3110308 RepID=A0ABU5RT28_9CYAN|nr:hypothetical protein [Cyanobium gracile]MEA5390904.1 hypothetical protein [Cyanobium gracile UHCC 0139]